MRVEAGRETEARAWLSQRGVTPVHPYVTLAMVEDGEIVAVAIYNNYQDSNIDLSVIFGKTLPLTRGHLRALFTYPFKQLGVNRISVRTRASFLNVRKQIRRLGFKPEGKHIDFYGTDAAFSYGMTRRMCKWL